MAPRTLLLKNAARQQQQRRQLQMLFCMAVAAGL
jgi:hypothetical protein